ncbi:hypothetical protein [Streptomyces sp. DH8]|uniref:hypothetical protein n=1 Tax=Streptomyces sp. DH8 TaxID=2857008 RepID=UPI001E2F9EFC|nr:hypothetical protein [Streptomyces sp. DH8]
MASRRRAAAVAPARPEPRALPAGGVLLDWASPGHWDGRAQLPCRYCGCLTHLRDDRGRPADKVCAEVRLAEVSRVVHAHGTQGLL